MRLSTHITSCLRDISADLLRLVLALHLPLSPAGLALPLLPHHGLVGGDVHTELLVVKVHTVLAPRSVLAVTRRPSVDQVLTVGLHNIAGATGINK